MEETGWKLVHGDVFRPPKNSKLLATFIGSGIQIFFMSLITLGKSHMTYLMDFHISFIPDDKTVK